MPARIRRVDSGPERNMVTGMIVSKDFTRQLIPIYRPELLQSGFARTVAGWCYDYWQTYQDVPGETIQEIFESKEREGIIEQDQIEVVATFLSSISDEYARASKFNVSYGLDQAEAYFKARSLKALSEDIRAALSGGTSPSEVEALLAEYKKVRRPDLHAIDPFGDRRAIKAAWDELTNPLLTMRGALGEFLGPMYREDFIAFMGPEKRGKSWWLIEVGMVGVRADLNVAFFAVGDLSQRQMTRRLHSYLARANALRAQQVLQPVLDCLWNQTQSCSRAECPRQPAVTIDNVRVPFDKEPNHKVCTACRSERHFAGAPWYVKTDVPKLDWRQAVRQGQALIEKYTKRFLLSCHPSSSISVKGIESELMLTEEMTGFVPDLIVIDYADVLAPIDPRQDKRDRINETWMAMRALSQVRRCLVVTATQSDADSYEKKTLSMKNFTDDKRKLGHVTHMAGLNQTPEEKREGIMRLNKIVVREDSYDIAGTVKVLQCLEMGRPFLTSYF